MKKLDTKLNLRIFRLCYDPEKILALLEAHRVVTNQVGFFLFHLNNLISFIPNLLLKYQLGTGKNIIQDMIGVAKAIQITVIGSKRYWLREKSRQSSVRSLKTTTVRKPVTPIITISKVAGVRHPSGGFREPFNSNGLSFFCFFFQLDRGFR